MCTGAGTGSGSTRFRRRFRRFRRSGKRWCRARSGSTGFGRKFRRRFRTRSEAKSNRVPEKVPEKVPVKPRRKAMSGSAGFGLAPPPYLQFFAHMHASVGPPSRGLASSCLPFLPTCVPVVDGCLSLPLHRWCIRFPEVLPPLVSQCLPISEPALEGASAIPRSCLLLSPIASPHVSLCCMLASHGLRTGVLVLDGMSVFPRFVSPCLHLFRYMYAGCWMVCPPSRGLVSPSLRLCSIVSHMCACVRCCVRLPEVLSPIVSHCLPTYVCLCWMVCPLVSPCFPLFPLYCDTRELALEGVFTFPRSRLPIVSPYINIPLSPTVSQCLPLLSLSPIALIVSPHACLWMVGSPF